MKTTKQGVRDLGGNSRVRQEQVVVGCEHVWERVKGWDCDSDKPYCYLRCGLCHAHSEPSERF